MGFGAWVKQQRLAKGATQKACAIRLGVSTTAWWKYEADTTDRWEYDTVVGIADALGVSRMEALRQAGYAESVKTFTIERPFAPEGERDKIPEYLSVQIAGMIQMLQSMQQQIDALSKPEAGEENK